MSSIAVFDSGLGGLTVLKAIRESLPEQQVIYFGDTARVPYGIKSKETIVRYSQEVSQFLVSQQIKMLVIACNTASTYASDQLRKELPVPVVDVVTPLIEEIASLPSIRHIAVLGTQATISSGVYQEKLSHCLPKAKISSVACPLFVPLVEEHFQNHQVADLIVYEYLKQFKENPVDTVILGCTHYPLMRVPIRNFFGPNVRIIDSADSCAKEVKKMIDSGGTHKILSDKPKLKYFVSDDPEKFKRLGEQFLGVEIGPVEKIQLR